MKINYKDFRVREGDRINLHKWPTTGRAPTLPDISACPCVNENSQWGPLREPPPDSVRFASVANSRA